jgi:hypothetical protein
MKETTSLQHRISLLKFEFSEGLLETGEMRQDQVLFTVCGCWSRNAAQARATLEHKELRTEHFYSKCG